jgi:hypothetical protein
MEVDMPTIPSRRFYVYVLCRPNGKPFYVGKGSGPRVLRHEEEARAGCKCHKCNIVRKIWRGGGEVQRYIVFTTDDETEAYTYEAETIALYGLDTLVNQAAGGKGGSSGVVRSADARARQSAIITEQMRDPAARERSRAGANAAWADTDYRERVRIAHKTASAAKWADPDYRAKMSAANKAAQSTPEARARKSEVLSARNKARWDDPVYRERMTAMLRAQAGIANEAAVKARKKKKD